MELNFVKENEVYRATAVVANDFNLHLEMVQGGQVRIDVDSTSTGKYANAFIGQVYDDGIFDYDFDARVYPKQIRITTTSLVTKGVVTEVEA